MTLLDPVSQIHKFAFIWKTNFIVFLCQLEKTELTIISGHLQAVSFISYKRQVISIARIMNNYECLVWALVRGHTNLQATVEEHMRKRVFPWWDWSNHPAEVSNTHANIQSELCNIYKMLVLRRIGASLKSIYLKITFYSFTWKISAVQNLSSVVPGNYLPKLLF